MSGIVMTNGSTRARALLIGVSMVGACNGEIRIGDTALSGGSDSAPELGTGSTGGDGVGPAEASTAGAADEGELDGSTGMTLKLDVGGDDSVPPIPPGPAFPTTCAEAQTSLSSVG
ncbi:MAG: hypothetical protein AAF721_19755, partial [Myxococcota bacterium]